MSEAGLLDSILERLGALPEKERAEVVRDAMQATAHLAWVPNPGPQTEAYFCEADELFYGGEAGGGKSDLLIGLSLNEHKRSLVLRRTNKEADKLIPRYTEVLGNTRGWNSQKGTWTLKGRAIDIGGCQLEDDKQKRKGIPHDLKGFDEVSDFTESQYLFITAWNRSEDQNQRCRVVATGNPPTRPEGLWVIRRWAPWLDPHHPNPAKPGELRWFVRDDEDRDVEVPGPGVHTVGGKPFHARSRTFIRSRLADNPDLARTNYAATLDALPKELRDAYRDGRFDAGIKDQPFQTIPADWVRQAQARWTPTAPQGIPMCALGVDPAAGGPDETTIARRHDSWFAPVVAVPGIQTPLGKDIAALVVKHRRGDAVVVIDLGGGYGLGAFEHLQNNNIPVIGHKGADGTTARTRDRKFGFYNKRAEVYWKFREALDPDQEGGAWIALPPDPALVADLCAPTFEVVARNGGSVIKLETKESLVTRLGRSPDRGDAVVNAWSAGATMGTHYGMWAGEMGGGERPLQTTANMGHNAARRRR